MVGEHKNSLGRSAEVLEEVLANKERLDELYNCIYHDDAWVRMRAIDTFEKVIRQHPEWAEPYVADIFARLLQSKQASIQWHLAEIFRQIQLSVEQQQQAREWMIGLLSSPDVDWIVAANTMDTLKQFVDDGLLPRAKFEKLLKIQLNHKSKSVVKKAGKHLAALKG